MIKKVNCRDFFSFKGSFTIMYQELNLEIHTMENSQDFPSCFRASNREKIRALFYLFSFLLLHVNLFFSGK